ncbi:MAG: tetratricopeptide repeat protein [Verrucomicrobia bacterium]|nr:tetratricopeptide repeat protein [Verrucomicrobiota bacterium]
MNSDSLTFNFPISDFDISKLPIDPAVLKQDPEMLREAISDYYLGEFRGMGGDAWVTITDGVVNVAWVPVSGIDGLEEHGIALLKRGDYALGIPLLKSVLARALGNPDVLLNLGMALSDQGKTGEAIDLLERLVALEPHNVRGWNALGVAHSRNKAPEAAEEALRRSLQLDPADGYAHRNLASILMRSAPREGLEHYRLAAELLPDDQNSQFGYGLALLKSGDSDSADPVLKRSIEMAPLTEIAEMARTARREIAQKSMRSAGGSAPRPDAIMYCLSAIQLFAASPELRKAVTFEIALLGRGGLDINSTDQKYSLKSLPGKFSGLQLVSYMYVGMKELDPGSDPGIDLSGEYEQARQISPEQ